MWKKNFTAPFATPLPKIPPFATNRENERKEKKTTEKKERQQKCLPTKRHPAHRPKLLWCGFPLKSCEKKFCKPQF